MTDRFVKEVFTSVVLGILVAHGINMVSAAGFTLYEHINYAGATYPAPSATAGCKNLYPDNNFNDLASSAKFDWASEPRAARVVFFEHGECVGDSYGQNKGSDDLPAFNSYWNDKWSSYVWTLNTAAFTLYEHHQYGGAKYTAPPATPGCVNLDNFNDVTTSATFDYSFWVSSATRVTFYEHANCVGDSWYRESGGNDEPAFSSYWNDKWSSYQWTFSGGTPPSTPAPTSGNGQPPTSGFVAKELTNYYFVKEADYTGSATAQLSIDDGSVLTVKQGFKDDVSMEGAGLTVGNKIVNLNDFGGTFSVKDNTFGSAYYGLGDQDNLLKPFVSVAVSSAMKATPMYAHGKTLYIKDIAGKKVPYPDGTTDANSKVHDGCVRVDDECGFCTEQGTTNIDFLVVRKQFENDPNFPFRKDSVQVAPWDCTPQTYW